MENEIVRCTKCGALFCGDRRTCPTCGAAGTAKPALSEKRQQGGSNGNGCLAAIIIFIFLWIVSLFGGDGGNERDRTCPWCNGTGYDGNGAKTAVEYVLRKTPCQHCKGKGTY